MENEHKIDVTSLDASHLRALEELLGHTLAPNQQVVISVVDAARDAVVESRPPQTLEDWAGVYVGFSDDEIESVDRLLKTRANLSRDFS